MTTHDSEALALRCEQATGPDRKLDALIASAVGLPHGQDSGWSNNENGDCWTVDECAAEFTASLDAAMTLVPEGCNWCIDTREGPPAANVGGMWVEGRTPALALCAASLRARA